jgi:acyl-CoA-binding protein
MHDQWKKYLDEGLSAEEAEKKYIELGEEVIAKYS